MGYGICLKVWGDYACFTRPEMKVERVSYDIMTPSAARGILESIYWKPAIKWVIDKIHVINPILFTNIRRNEVSDKISVSKVLAIAKGVDEEFYTVTTENRQQRASLILRDVCYFIEAHFEMTDKVGERDNEKEHYNIAIRRMSKGQFHKQPVFGTREFPAFFELVDKPDKSELKGEQDLGFMLFDMDFKGCKEKNIFYNDADPIFYRPKMVDGVVDVLKCYKETVKL